jgi:hypothetical protein
MKKPNPEGLWSEIYYSLIFPALFTLFYFLSVSIFNLDFIQKILVAAFLLSVLMVYMVVKKWDERNSGEIMALRELVLLTTGAVILLGLGYQNNPDKNDLGIIPWLVPGVLSVTASISFVSFKMGRYSNNPCYYHTETSKVLVFLITTACAWQSCLHFGSQYIWIPGLISLAAIFTWGNNIDTSEKYRFSVPIAATVNIIALAVSNLYQFWSVWQKITDQLFALKNSGYAQPFLVAIIAIFVLFVGYEIISRIKDKKRKKLAAKKAEQDLIQRVAADEKKRKQMEEIKEEIISGHGNNWENILTVARYYDFETDKFSGVCKVIPLIPLAQTITISELKKQIIWHEDFPVAANIIEKIVKNTYSDEIIYSHMDQVSDLIESLEHCKQFIGYNKLMDQLKKNCSTVWDLIYPFVPAASK